LLVRSSSWGRPTFQRHSGNLLTETSQTTFQTSELGAGTPTTTLVVSTDAPTTELADAVIGLTEAFFLRTPGDSPESYEQRLRENHASESFVSETELGIVLEDSYQQLAEDGVSVVAQVTTEDIFVSSSGGLQDPWQVVVRPSILHCQGDECIAVDETGVELATTWRYLEGRWVADYTRH